MRGRKKTSTGLVWEFSDSKVTPWGGMLLIKEFLDRSGFMDALESCGLPEPESNRGYRGKDVISSFWVSVWIGAVRFTHTAAVRFDEALKRIYGWKSVPSATTFTRYFRRFNRRTVDEVFGALNEWFWARMPARAMTIDLDSSVIERYGDQEGSVAGYNPKKPGRNSHHPIIAFAAHLRMVIHSWLRPGNAGSAHGSILFMEEVLRTIGAHTVGLVRADSGFFDGAFMSYLERGSIPYIICARMNKVLRGIICGVRDWTPVAAGIEVGECVYKALPWENQRRFIVVRQHIQTRPDAQGKLLFESDEYRYQTLCTNMSLPAYEIWTLYRGRSDSENRIKELKYDFGIGGFCMKSFYATEAAFRFVMMGYNIISLFRQSILRSSKHTQLSGLKYHCFAIGSVLTRRGHQDVLRLSIPAYKRAWFTGLFSKLTGFDPPTNFAFCF